MFCTNNYEKNMLRDVLEELMGKLEKFPLKYIHVFMEQSGEPEFVLVDVYRTISVTAQFLPPNPAIILRRQSSLKHLERQDSISSKVVHR